jgi:ATP-dependent Clp protease ATP-binding subunit ClpC
MTSNIGADRIMSSDPFGFMKRDEEVGYEKMKDMLVNELERFFRPEFINRIDEVVVFHKLMHNDLLNILDLETRKVAIRLEEHGLKLELTEQAKELLLEKGTDEKFGARPLRRCISSMVEDPLSEKILRDEFAGKNVIRVGVETTGEGDAAEKQLMFEGIEAPPEPPENKEEQPEPVANSETT